VCLAGCAASEEFCPRLPKHPPSGHLAGQSASEGLHLRVPKAPSDESVVRDGEGCLRVAKYLPDNFLGTDKCCSSNIVSKTIRTSTDYSPLSKAALLLSEMPPAALSQVLIPCLGFNGHKPASFIEGEGWLKESVISKKHKASVLHSLVRKMAHMPLVPRHVASSKVLPHSPCLLHSLPDTAGTRQCLEYMDAVSTETGLVLRTEPRPSQMMVIR
jgi:hypothetical protein